MPETNPSSREINYHYVSRGDSCHFDFSLWNLGSSSQAQKVNMMTSQPKLQPRDRVRSREAIQRSQGKIDNLSLGGLALWVVVEDIPASYSADQHMKEEADLRSRLRPSDTLGGRNSVLAKLALFFVLLSVQPRPCTQYGSHGMGRGERNKVALKYETECYCLGWAATPRPWISHHLATLTVPRPISRDERKQKTRRLTTPDQAISRS